MSKAYKKQKLIQEFLLPVDEVNKIHVATYGNQKGIPVLYVHGGPGGGCSLNSTYFFDPKKYYIILFDQRGCGKSTPFLSTYNNNTFSLVEDMEKIRQHLKLNKVLLFGGSYGSTLALAYAIKYPRNVITMVLRGIFLGREEDVNWLYIKGTSEQYPEEHEKFLNLLAPEKRSDPIKGYYEIFQGQDEVLKKKAFKMFSNYEGSVVSIDNSKRKNSTLNQEPTNREIAIAFLENYFFYHHTFLKDDNYILDNIAKIKDIKTYIIHGRYDVICRPSSAYLLHKNLPNSELNIVEMASHSSFDEVMFKTLKELMDKLKKQIKG